MRRLPWVHRLTDIEQPRNRKMVAPYAVKSGRNERQMKKEEHTSKVALPFV
jgi:hypothetical protein